MNPQSNIVRTHLQAIIFIEIPGRPDANIGHARLQNFNAEHDYGAQPVHGVGDYLPAEFAHLKFAGSIQIGAFMVRKADLVALGLAALGEAILTVGVINLKLFDPQTKKNLRVYKGCVMGRYSEKIQEGQICGEDASMLFRDVIHDPEAYTLSTGPDPLTYQLPAALMAPQPSSTTGATTTNSETGSVAPGA